MKAEASYSLGEGNVSMRNIRTVVCAVAVLSFVALPALAADMGTPAEAKAMLEKVAAGLKANEAQTLASINKGEYKDRICIRSVVARTASTPPMAQSQRRRTGPQRSDG